MRMAQVSDPGPAVRSERRKARLRDFPVDTPPIEKVARRSETRSWGSLCDLPSPTSSYCTNYSGPKGTGIEIMADFS